MAAIRIKDYIYFHEKDGLFFSYRFYPDGFVIYTHFYDDVRFPNVSQYFVPTQQNVSIGCYKIEDDNLELIFSDRNQRGYILKDGSFGLVGEDKEIYQFDYFYVVLKEDWSAFKQILIEHRIKSLYHFTDRTNLSSIISNGGLFSWKNCQEKSINISKPSSDSLSRRLDNKFGLQDFVRLSFTKNHPMMYAALNEERISDPVILEISPDVIYFLETQFSDMNATRNGHCKGDTIDHFKKIKFEIVTLNNHFNLEDDQKKYYQAEILVKDHIPINYIGQILEPEFLSDFEDDFILYY